ncbi:hypothetical protein CEXT_778141 [Caerostris extrusa]|uniref:Uncharacterized protein n=1 Tax=Caerostris extrusa TaxID=172846 RepID=A0AAV4R985_CAEEX|nr:hypothetical protein CEXT_778141 [Caerostris extrusa]
MVLLTSPDYDRMGPKNFLGDPEKGPEAPARAPGVRCPRKDLVDCTYQTKSSGPGTRIICQAETRALPTRRLPAKACLMLANLLNPLFTENELQQRTKVGPFKSPAFPVKPLLPVKHSF